MNRTAVFWILPLTAICRGAYGWQLGRFLAGSTGGTRRQAGIFSILYFICIFVWDLAAEFWMLPYILSVSLWHLFFGALVIFLFKGGWERKVSMAVVLTAIDTLVGNFSSSLFSAFALAAKNTLKIGGTSYLSMESGYILGCLSVMATALALWLLSGRLALVFSDKVKRWYLFLSVPVVFIVAVIDVVGFAASRGVLVVSNASGAQYWNEYYNELYSYIALSILTGISMCAVGFYVFGMNRIYLEQRKKERYGAQAAYYKMLKEQYGQMERLRHDMKNHLTGLKVLWENRQWDRLGEYLEKMMEAGNLGAGEEATGSRVVDALLGKKRSQAKEAGVLWSCEVQVPGDGAVDEFDLCVMMGNALDNALEACQRMEGGTKRFIDVRAGMVKQCFLLEVRNSTKLRDIKETEFSSKKGDGEHGIGLLNIKDTLGKYDGAMNVEVEGGVFILSLLVPLRGR